MENKAKKAKKASDTLTYRCVIQGMAVAFRAKRIVEVGVYGAGLSRLLAVVPTLDRLTLVDPWRAPFLRFDQAHMDGIASGVMDWARHLPKVDVLRMTSVEAAQFFGEDCIDFFHTDGDHETDMVRADILAWLPKVCPGGLLTGDNYDAATVGRAVDELLPHRLILSNGRVWCARKLS